MNWGQDCEAEQQSNDGKIGEDGLGIINVLQ